MTKNYKYLLSCASGIALLFAHSSALATNPTGHLIVTANPHAQCKFGAIEPLNFGQITGAEDQLAKQHEITVTCTNGQFYHLKANKGLNNGATRLLKSEKEAGVFLAYDLYHNDGKTLWGYGHRLNAVARKGTGKLEKINFKGKIYDNANVSWNIDSLPFDKMDHIFSDTVELTLELVASTPST